MIDDDKDTPWIWFYQVRLMRPFDAVKFREAREEIVASCLRQGIAEVNAWDLSAAADELLCNVLEHSEAQWLDLGVCQNAANGMVRLRLLDDGQRFDVALATEHAEEAAGDGNGRHMGLVMIKGVSKDLRYEQRPDGGNELVLSLT
jgi:anti-sigma regulatory factor (Ser/Thr protein kinase)